MIRFAVLAAGVLGFTAQAADPVLDAAIQDCAPNVAPSTMRALIAVESKGNPLAINLNGADGQLQHQPTSEAEAVSTARWLLANGYNFDAGLAQINSANYGWLGLNDRNVFNVCINLAAAETVLRRDYQRSLEDADGPHPVLATLSRYNTGSASRGFANGYVRKVQLAAARDLDTVAKVGVGPIPLTHTAAPAKADSPTPRSTAKPARRPRDPADVFGTDTVADVYQAAPKAPLAATDTPGEAQP